MKSVKLFVLTWKKHKKGKQERNKNDLGGPVEAGDDTMFGPALIHELPVERELCSGLNFTGEKQTQINKNTYSKTNYKFVCFTLLVQLLPLLLLQVTATVVKEEVHMLWQSPLNDASAVLEEIHKLLRVQDLQFFLLCQLVRGCYKEKKIWLNVMKIPAARGHYNKEYDRLL